MSEPNSCETTSCEPITEIDWLRVAAHALIKSLPEAALKEAAESLSEILRQQLGI